MVLTSVKLLQISLLYKLKKWNTLFSLSLNIFNLFSYMSYDYLQTILILCIMGEKYFNTEKLLNFPVLVSTTGIYSSKPQRSGPI